MSQVRGQLFLHPEIFLKQENNYNSQWIPDSTENTSVRSNKKTCIKITLGVFDSFRTRYAKLSVKAFFIWCLRMTFQHKVEVEIHHSKLKQL